MKKILLTMFSITLLFNLNSYSQSAGDAEKPKVFGIGIEVSKFSWNDIYSNLSNPVTSLVFTISTQKNFRLQPVIGFVVQKSNSDFIDADVISTAMNFGLGFCGVSWKDKVAITYGLDWNYTLFKDKYKNTGFVDFTLDGNAMKIGPSLGAEYFFSPNFSFGATTGLKYFTVSNESVDINYNYGYIYSIKESVSGILFDSSVLVRIYF